MAPRPIAPIRRALIGARARVPASKSVTNRELVLSAIASGRSRLDVGALDPGDDVATIAAAIAALGHEVRWRGPSIEVVPRSAPSDRATIDAREAGTVARFATALAALSSGETRIDGSARMRERPMSALIGTLRELGA
ncbi:MAG TPA: 3-phosphoshikimate 1-carboxyvinyltransferase, partial [Candidatus Limnocylindria bacterium]|nr:3-phosphoshikimate 1-carboxyvinyltransferase [Candidatus Limnocylindria bacterium]